MIRYMLDTNMVGHLVRGNRAVATKVAEVPMADLCISAVTGGELMFGLAKLPQATRLNRAVTELLARVDVLPWDDAAMRRYGILRADLAQKRQSLAPLDMLIAAHAIATERVLVANDAAFNRVTGLSIEDWTRL